jgi:truncated hemoglobin YjbI
MILDAGRFPDQIADMKTTCNSVGGRSLPFRAAFAPVIQRAAYHLQMPHAAH